MTMTSEFVQRSRARLALMRSMLLQLRKTSAETFAQIGKISRQQAADVGRLGDRFGKISDELDTDYLPHAPALRDEIEGLAGIVEEDGNFGAFAEDLMRGIRELIDDDGLRALKKSDEQLKQLEKLAAKLGV